MSMKNGGPAFPIPGLLDDEDFNGMTLRDYLAAKAPVNFGMAVAVWGDDQLALHKDRTRAAFLAVWAMLRYEWADAMLVERERSIP